ncbi:MAG: glycosyltransferase family 39 protein [Polyangiales bacterium]
MTIPPFIARLGAADTLQRLAVLALLAASGAILVVVNTQYPVSDWMLVSLSRTWFLVILWLLGCGSLGWRALRLIKAHFESSVVHHLIAVTVGVALFAMVVVGAGVAGSLNTIFFFAAPLVCLATSGRRYWMELRELLRGSWRIATETRLTAPLLLAIGIVAVGLLLVYVPILTPHNIQHDARWYHLPIAQQYASQGSLAPFAEGWFLASYPHLSSFLYTWALLLPAPIVARLELAAHLEFGLFCLTVLGTGIAARSFSGRRSGYLAATVFFLFPGFFVYDSNLSSGADHVAAFWAPAMLLLLHSVWVRSRLSDWVLAGLVMGAAAGTKYSAICLVAPGIACLAVRALLNVFRGSPEQRRLALFGLPLAGCLILVMTAPHWLRNALSFGDPLYPLLADWFPSKVWNPDAQMYFQQFQDQTVWRGQTSWAGLLRAMGTAITFGFEVHEYGFHGNLPTFGFLFAISLWLAPLAKVGRATWGTFALCLTGIVVWYLTYHRDRYLQALLPWMVVACTSVLVALYDTRRRSIRFGIAVLLGAQLIAAADLPFIRSHVMIPGKHPLPHALERLALGFEGKAQERDTPYDTWAFADWTRLGAQLPDNARVLIHRDRLWLGLDAPVVVDEPAWQGGLAYGALGNSAAMYDRLKELGVTHIITGRGHGDGGSLSISGALTFWSFVKNHTTLIAKSGHLSLWKLPETRPTEHQPSLVSVRTCTRGPRSGIYELSALAYVSNQDRAQPLAEPGPPTQFLVIENGCGKPPEGYGKLTTEGSFTMWEHLRR